MLDAEGLQLFLSLLQTDLIRLYLFILALYYTVPLLDHLGQTGIVGHFVLLALVRLSLLAEAAALPHVDLLGLEFLLAGCGLVGLFLAASGFGGCVQVLDVGEDVVAEEGDVA